MIKASVAIFTVGLVILVIGFILMVIAHSQEDAVKGRKSAIVFSIGTLITMISLAVIIIGAVAKVLAQG